MSSSTVGSGDSRPHHDDLRGCTGSLILGQAERNMFFNETQGLGEPLASAVKGQACSEQSTGDPGVDEQRQKHRGVREALMVRDILNSGRGCTELPG